MTLTDPALKAFVELEALAKAAVDARDAAVNDRGLISEAEDAAELFNNRVTPDFILSAIAAIKPMMEEGVPWAEITGVCQTVGSGEFRSVTILNKDTGSLKMFVPADSAPAKGEIEANIPSTGSLKVDNYLDEVMKEK